MRTAAERLWNYLSLPNPIEYIIPNTQETVQNSWTFTFPEPANTGDSFVFFGNNVDISSLIVDLVVKVVHSDNSTTVINPRSQILGANSIYNTFVRVVNLTTGDKAITFVGNTVPKVTTWRSGIGWLIPSSWNTLKNPLTERSTGVGTPSGSGSETVTPTTFSAGDLCLSAFTTYVGGGGPSGAPTYTSTLDLKGSIQVGTGTTTTLWNVLVGVLRKATASAITVNIPSGSAGYRYLYSVLEGS